MSIRHIPTLVEFKRDYAAFWVINYTETCHLFPAEKCSLSSRFFSSRQFREVIYKVNTFPAFIREVTYTRTTYPHSVRIIFVRRKFICSNCYYCYNDTAQWGGQLHNLYSTDHAPSSMNLSFPY